MSEKIINLIIVTEQLKQIDFIEKALKSRLQINAYTSNDVLELKKILSKGSIDIVVVDDAKSSLGVGSIRSAIKDLHLKTVILQLEHRSSGETDSTYIKNGASIVCAHNDALAILHNTELLIAYSNGQKKLEENVNLITTYRDKFNELYIGLADPICYIQDGVFLDCNPAFLRTFEVNDKEELDELTILNFVSRKQQTDFKSHLKKSTRRDLSANPVMFSMQTKLGKSVEFIIMSKPSKYDNEDAVQLYMRSTAEGGGGGATLFDESTGLANREQMGFYIEQKVQSFGKNDGQGFLVYLIIKNYRDVWGSDGFVEAEKFIKAIAGQVRKTLPVHTEASRYTDDGLLMFIPGDDRNEMEAMLSKLIRELDSLTPEGMVRMVEPSCYAAYDGINKDSDYLDTISTTFRSSRNASLTEGSRVSEPTNMEVAKKDTLRLEILQTIVANDSMKMQFQPIASFEPDGNSRYRERLQLIHENEDIELEELISAAERYQLMHRIDKWKMNHLFDEMLEMDASERENLQVFITLSTDSLNNTGFCDWLVEQLDHTGLGGGYFVFELMSDNVLNAYSGAMKLSKAVRASGAQVAVSKIGGLTNDNRRIIDDLKPDIIKLDLREIDTLDDNEEEEVMGDIQAKAEEVGAMLIAEYLESPAQLSRIWPYGITFIQGDGMTPLLDKMNFNFNEFEI